ncbi:MAG: hypothetical protein ABIR57_01685 [Aeromicrobium sp.]
MPYANPHVCPSCTGAIAGEPQCPHCKFNLNSPAAAELWQTLLRADALLTRAQFESSAPAAAAVAAPLPVPGPPTPASSVAAKPRWSTGSILLALGALCFLVAAIVFISVSWDVLGATGRTLVLLAITAAFAGVAVWSTRARLRASAESLWTVFLGFFTIDFFAARAYGLFGLDSLSSQHASLAFGIIAMILGAAIVLESRKLIPLVTPSIAAGLAIWLASFSVAATVDWSFFWCAFSGLVFAVVVSTVAWRVELKLIAWIGGAAGAVLYLTAGGAAIVRMIDEPHLPDLVAHGHGIPMLVMISTTAAIGVATPRLVIPASALVILGWGSLIFTPAQAAAPHEGGFIAASVLAVVLTGGFIRGSNDWLRGARIGAAAILATLATSSLGWLAYAIDAIDQSNRSGFGSSWSTRLPNPGDLPGPGRVAFVVFAAIALSVAAMLRWPGAGRSGRSLRLAPVVVAELGLVLGVIAYEPYVILAALLVVVLGAGLLVLSRKEHEIWIGVAMTVTILPVVLAFSSKPITLTVWISVALVFAMVAGLAAPTWARRVSSLVSAGLSIGVVTLGADMASLGERGVRMAALFASILFVVAAGFAFRRFVGRREMEIAGAIGMFSVIVSTVDLPLGAQALFWTIGGASLVLVSLFVHDRGWLRYVGSAALGVAWVMRLLASDVSTIEAYTMPFAVVLLGGGFWAMRGDPQLRTVVALTPGLTLALLPSVPPALEDPTGLRALLLGLAALASLGAGIWRKWQMPFVFGSVVLALLVVWNTRPLANELPLWIILTSIAVILSGLGITWENRVRNARSAAQYVENLR